MDSELVIVGAGVAGASAALEAARHGMKVAVLEEHQKVGMPWHCSGHVGISTLSALGVDLPDQLIQNKVHGAIFFSPSGEIFRLRKRDPVTLVVDRSELDRYLISKAQDAGAELFLGWRAERAYYKSDHIALECRTNSEKTEFGAQVIVDAEGASAQIPRVLGLPPLGRRMIVNSAQALVKNAEGLERDSVEVFFGQRYSPGFFAWIIPLHDGLAKVGLAASGANPRQCLHDFMRTHPIASGKLAGSEIVDGPVFHPIPVGGPIKHTYAERLMVAGDAAGQVKATTGGGIVFGIICGVLAARTANEASEAGNFSKRFLSRYEARWKAQIGFDLIAMNAIRRMLFRMPDSQIDRLIGLATKLDLSEVLEQTSDIDFQGRTLFRLSRDPRLPAAVLFSLVASLPNMLRDAVLPEFQASFRKS